jgi:hypothetical protein
MYKNIYHYTVCFFYLNADHHSCQDVLADAGFLQNKDDMLSAVKKKDPVCYGGI